MQIVKTARFLGFFLGILIGSPANPSFAQTAPTTIPTFLFLKCAIEKKDGNGEISHFTRFYRVPRESQNIEYSKWLGKWNPDIRAWVQTHRLDDYDAKYYRRTTSVDENFIKIISTYNYNGRSHALLNINRRTGVLFSTEGSDLENGRCEVGEPDYSEKNAF